MKHDDASTRAGVNDDPWTLSASGKKVYFLRPTADMFVPDDLARHLSQICRFTGATNQFYSVAQHCVLVGQLVKADLDAAGVDKWSAEYYEQIIAALLHDSAEAFCNDISSPLKSAINGKYKWIETGILRAIFNRFGIDWAYNNAMVKKADTIALVIERYYLMPDHPDWPKVSKAEMTYVRPAPMDPADAASLWLNSLRVSIVKRNKYAMEFGDAV
jgi:hypothetical protein